MERSGSRTRSDSVYDSDAGFLVSGLDFDEYSGKNPWISYQTETLSDQIDREIGTQIRQTLSREWLRWLAGEDSHLSNDENHPNTQNRLENIRQIEIDHQQQLPFPVPIPGRSESQHQDVRF